MAYQDSRQFRTIFNNYLPIVAIITLVMMIGIGMGAKKPLGNPRPSGIIARKRRKNHGLPKGFSPFWRFLAKTL